MIPLHEIFSTGDLPDEIKYVILGVRLYYGLSTERYYYKDSLIWIDQTDRGMQDINIKENWGIGDYNLCCDNGMKYRLDQFKPEWLQIRG